MRLGRRRVAGKAGSRGDKEIETWQRSLRNGWRHWNGGWRKCGGIFDVERREKKVSELDAKASSPDFWNDPAAARAVIDETNRHRLVLKPFSALKKALEEGRVLLDLAVEESDPEQKALARKDVEEILSRAETKFERLEIQALLSDEFDDNDAYMTLHAGAGGTESCDWADMLFRMYRRYFETHEFDSEIIEYQRGDEAGVKSVTVSVSGPYAYGTMKSERGVHRLVRISPFDANKRRHTSFAAVDVVPEVGDEIEVEIKEEDLRIDTYRSQGAGGQHVNTTDSAVRVTHLPTGLVVACQAERSQHKNRAMAMKVLKARLYELKRDEQRKDMEKFYGDKGEIAWGSQIRSYVLQPYTMVKDHRTGVETSNVERVLDGDIETFIEGYLKSTAGQQQGGGKG